MALVALLAYVGATEMLLQYRGFAVEVRNSTARWVEARKLASQLGPDSLIMLGASRIQLGVDMRVVASETGLRPVQLAIDGSSFMPVLEGIAEDPRVAGTLLIDFSPNAVLQADDDSSASHQQAYSRGLRLFDWNYRVVDERLRDVLEGALRNYASGARPLDTLMSRLLAAQPVRQYLVTNPDRSRDADYSVIGARSAYLRRVKRNLGAADLEITGNNMAEIERQLLARVAVVRPVPWGPYEQVLPRLVRAVERIRGRGGRVVFVNMPVSGMVREIEERRYPRELFYAPLAAVTGAPLIDYRDYPELSAFNCPDGSHLDRRDKAAFSRALAKIINSMGS